MHPVSAFIYHHRPRLTILLALAVIGFARPSIESLILGSIVLIIGEIGRMWASGYIEKNAELATSGPYRFSRNPLYVANFIMFIGCCIMSANIWVGATVLIGYLVIYIPVMRHEAGHMINLFGDQYHAWAEKVPMFFPWPSGWTPPNPKKYSWKLMREHDELFNMLGVPAGIAIFVAIYWYQNS